MPVRKLDTGGSLARGRRRAFTLLEMLLAASMALVLLAAVYTAMNIQIRSTQGGRDLVEQAQLARGLVRQMRNDISQSLGPVKPNNAQSSSSQGASSSTSGTSSTTDSSTDGSTPAAGSGGTYNKGLKGSSTQVTIYMSRVPRELTYLTPSATLDNSQIPVVSDLRSVTYWMAGGTDSPLGLARLELTGLTTDDDTPLLPPNIPDEASYVEAKEVRSVQFQYFDGTNWQDTWDGSQVGTDGMTPIGPPVAIAITLKIAPPGTSSDTSDQQSWKTYRHVVCIPTANGVTPQSLDGSTSP